MRVLAAGRRAAEALMTDQCRIVRPTGEVDPLTGKPTNPTPVYVGKCKVQTFRPHESLPEAGGAQWVVQRYEVHLPVLVGPVDADDEITITATTDNPLLLGKTFRVAAPDVKSKQTAQRVGVEQVVR